MSGIKRDRTTAKIDSKISDPDAPTPRPTKRSKPDLITPYTPQFQPQSTATIGQAIEPPTLLRGDFHNAIAQLRDGGTSQVSTHFKLNVKFDQAHATNIDVRGAFSVFTQSTGLVQGQLQTNNHTAYVGKDAAHSVLPDDLSFQRARLEARGIKQLAPVEGSYRAESKQLDLDNYPRNKGGGIPKVTVLGGIALGSHLEDITAKRAVGLEDVGSAIRAKTLTAKWRIKTEGNEDPGKGFRNKVLNAFPQLGSTKVSAGGLNQGGISALKKHWESEGNTFSKHTQILEIEKAHNKAYAAADGVFLHKFKKLQSGEGISSRWWTNNSARFQAIRADHNSNDQERQRNASQNFDEIRGEYRARKLTRHGIKYP